MHFSRFPQTCSITLLPVCPLKPGCDHFLPVCEPPPPKLNSLAVCQISHQWLHFSTSNSMAHLPRVAVLLCCIIFVMKCFYIVERSRRLQLKPLWLLSNKQLCKWRKKPRHFVNKNSLSYSIWLILTILLPHTGSHMIYNFVGFEAQTYLALRSHDGKKKTLLTICSEQNILFRVWVTAVSLLTGQ